MVKKVIECAGGTASGGEFIWASAFVTSAMRAQPHKALAQAGLLIGHPHLLQLDATEVSDRVGMDNIDRALVDMPRRKIACGSIGAKNFTDISTR